MMELHVGNIYTYVKNPTPKGESLIRRICSYTDPNYLFKLKNMEIDRKKVGSLYSDYVRNGIIYLYDTRTKRFPTGLLKPVVAMLKYNGVEFKIIEEYKEPKDIIDIELNPSTKLFPHQEKAFEKLRKNRFRGIVDGATGMGKTVLGVYLLAYLKTPTVIIVPTTVIRDQWVSQIERRILYLSKKKKISSGIMFYDRNGKEAIFVATMSLISSVIKSKKLKTEKLNERNRNLRKFFLFNVGLIIFDEVHLAGSDSGIAALSYIPALYRVGLTGSFNKREDNRDLEYIGLIGQRVCTITADELIERRRAVPLKIIFDEVIMPYIPRHANYEEVYLDAIVTNDERNDRIIEHAYKFIEEKRPVLILVDRIDHARVLSELSGFPYTSSEDPKKDEKIQKFRELDKDFPALICTTKLAGIGFDMPPLSAIILACGGKSAIKIIQAIGRALRMYEGKENSIIIDFADNCKYLREHAFERAKVYLSNEYYEVDFGKTFLASHFGGRKFGGVKDVQS